MPCTFIFLPPLAAPTGGIAVLHQIGAALHEAGRDTAFVLRDDKTWAPAFSRDVPRTAWDTLALDPSDTWLVPEGWVNALAPGLNAGARTLLYVQNWAYLFSALPPGVGWDQLDVEFLAVSDPVAWYIRESVGRQAPVLRPGIDLSLFSPPVEPLAGPSPGAPVRVAYMPRKNKAWAAQIRAVVEARAARTPGAPPIEWIEIAGQPPEGVAAMLRRAHLFLATGYPEGCPLPPLEAMASGCPVVGYGGLGGFDYMRQAAPLPGAFAPWFPLRDVPWGGNGLYAADADVMAAALALETAAHWAATGDERHRAAVSAALETARAYSVDAQREAIVGLLG